MSEGIEESGSVASIIKAVHNDVWNINLFLNRETAINYSCFGCGHVPKKCMSDEQYRPLCALCAQSFIEKGDKIVHSPFADGRIAQIQLKCKNKLVQDQDSDVEAEQKSDAAAPAENECKWNGVVKDWQSHNDDECLFTVKQCQHCQNHNCSKSLMTEHDDVCPEKSVECPQDCGDNILRKNTETHKANVCLKTILDCRNAECTEKVVREVHHVHETQQCPKRIVQCSFKKYGCNQPDIKAEELVIHEKNNQMEHLQLQVKYLQQTIEDQTGVIKMYSGRVDNIKAGWRICDGTNGTYDLSSKFVKGKMVNSDDDQKECENYALCFIVKVPQNKTI
eukprot:32273_1